jgi:hypothetical protein
LTSPESNIRLGTAYLADKIREFGALHLVLASYNAGEGTVRRWAMDRPMLPSDEFIDDIPFPETQNYVKKIIGTAEDYRRLYGSGSEPVQIAEAPPMPVDAAPARVAPVSKVTPAAAPKKAPAASHRRTTSTTPRTRRAAA